MLLLPIAPPIVILVVLAILMFLATESGFYAFDPEDAHGRGTFEPHGKNYMEVAKLVVGLGSASIAALAVCLFKTDLMAGARGYLVWPLVLFAATVVYGTAFIGLLAWRYERYCHNSCSYTRGWYVTILTLGFSC